MTIRFTPGPCKIAYDVWGQGSDVLLLIPGWVSHLQYDWGTPEIRSYYERLAHGRCIIRYDKRGTGLSDRPAGPGTYAPGIQVADIVRVLDAAGVHQAALLGWSEGGPIAVAFAAAHPDRLTRLILYGTYAKLHAAPNYPYGNDGSRGRALLDLVRATWGLGSRAFADLFIPDADLQRLAWFVEYQRIATSPEVAADILSATYEIDVRSLLPNVRQPTLVLHRLHDRVIPFQLGQYLAEHLPCAAFQMLDGEHHLPYFGTSSDITDAVDAFLSAEGVNRRPQPTAAPLSPRELDVLRLLAEGLQNRDIARTLNISPATVARHLANISG